MEKDIKLKRKKHIKIAISIILSIIIFINVLIVVFCSTVSSTLSYLDYKFYIMTSELQPEIAKKGDLVIVKEMKPGEVKKGDNIVYNDGQDNFCSTVIETRRVKTVYNDIIIQEDGIKYKFDEQDIQGKLVFRIKDLGRILKFLRTKLGMVFFAIFMLCWILLIKIVFINKMSLYSRKQTIEANA